MVRASKTTPATTPAPTKANSSKKAAAPVNEVTLTSVPAPVVEAAVPAPVESSSVAVKMTEFSAKLQQLIGLFSTMKSDFKTLEKVMSREMKLAAKASSKKRRSSGDRKPSGFVKPTVISDELAQFLGK